jgi:hypothetical protein
MTAIMTRILSVVTWVLLLSGASTTCALQVVSRRAWAVQQSMGISSVLLSTTSCVPLAHAAAPTTPIPSLDSLTALLQEAHQQLDPVPQLIQQEKWDSVRAILIKPPLSNCWTSSPRQPILNQFAQALGDAGGDELAALEAREDLISHLRYLDMAVYNNNFNPIATEGKSGATRELIRSYYEDPTREYQASVAGLDALLTLSKEVLP